MEHKIFGESMSILLIKRLSSIDPVCGLEIDPEKSIFKTSVRGHTYHFCTKKCQNNFNNNPMEYIDVHHLFKEKKNWWTRYLDRPQKETEDKPPKCC